MSTGEEVIAGLSGAADKVNSSAASVADGGERWIEASTSFAIAHNKRKERDKALRERDELLRRAAALREKAMGLDAEASAAEVRGLALAGEGRERIGQAKRLADEALTDALSVMEGSRNPEAVTTPLNEFASRVGEAAMHHITDSDLGQVLPEGRSKTDAMAIAAASASETALSYREWPVQAIDTAIEDIRNNLGRLG